MSKRKVIAIILFIFIGLFMFTYASPGDGIVESDEPVINEEDEVIDTGDYDTNNDNDKVQKPVKTSNIILEPERVVILLGEDYDVMAGLKIDTGRKLDIKVNITDTTSLEAGSHLIIYTATDINGKQVISTRTIVVLDPDGDEDSDGFTNEEELESPKAPQYPNIPEGENNPLVEVEKTNPEDDTSHPETYAPTITLLGDNPYIVLEGSKYEEPGFEITLDPHDKITTKEDVKITGEVDTDKAGVYELTYTITDRYGKTAEIKREIFVKTDKNNNSVADDEELTYTVTFEALKNGKLEGILVYDNILIDLTFEEAGIIVPIPIPNTYYEFKEWKPSTPENSTVVDGDLLFEAIFVPINDENENQIADEEEEYYNVIFEAVGKGTLEGTLVYEDILTDLTFEEAGIIVPTPVADTYYEFKEWKPSTPENSTVVDGNLLFEAIFVPINDRNQNGIADEEEEHTLTINYVYSRGEVASNPYVDSLEYLEEYAVQSPTIEYYIADILVVEGVMGYTDEEVTVVYTPINDVNGNQIADEEETYTLTINYVYESGEIASNQLVKDVLQGTNYSETSPIISNYIADKLVVEGVMPEEDVTVTVTYAKEDDGSDGEIITNDYTFILKGNKLTIKDVSSEISSITVGFKNGNDDTTYTDFSSQINLNTGAIATITVEPKEGSIVIYDVSGNALIKR